MIFGFGDAILNGMIKLKLRISQIPIPSFVFIIPSLEPTRYYGVIQFMHTKCYDQPDGSCRIVHLCIPSVGLTSVFNVRSYESSSYSSARSSSRLIGSQTRFVVPVVCISQSVKINILVWSRCTHPFLSRVFHPPQFLDNYLKRLRWAQTVQLTVMDSFLSSSPTTGIEKNGIVIDHHKHLLLRSESFSQLCF